MNNSQKETSQRILLMIPCYNEENSIGALLREIQELGEGYDTIVVDDGSQDNTYAVASQLSPCLKLATNLGIGGAVQVAIKYACEYNYETCIQVDGDGQHPPDQIKVLVESYRKSPANLIIGSRFLSDESYMSTWARRLGIKSISQTIKLLFNCKVSDPTSGFRLLDRKAIRLFSTQYPYDFPEPISIATALERGLAIRETPLNMRARRYGKSSISGLKNFSYMLRVVGYLILIRIGREI